MVYYGMLDFDQQFVERLIMGDKAVFSKFYLDTVDYFFRYLLTRYPSLPRADIDDILAGFYMKIWKVSYSEQENFKAYIRTILKNHIKDYFKKKKEYAFSQLDTEEEKFQDSISSDEDITEFIDLNFKKEKIQESIERLPTSEGDVFFLKFIEHKSNLEIEQILNISGEAVRQRMSRAVKRLKLFLGK